MVLLSVLDILLVIGRRRRHGLSGGMHSYLAVHQTDQIPTSADGQAVCGADFRTKRSERHR